MAVLSCAGVILAGGRSKRMGQDKGLLPFPDEGRVTFAEHLTSLLQPLCSEVVLVARDTTHAADYRHCGARILIDQIPDVGPLMGLYSGLSAIQTSHAIVIAVDMPCVQPDMVAFLLSQLLDDTLLVPVVAGIAQVLLAVYPRLILPAIEECLRQGRRDPRSLLERVKVRYIEEAQLRLVDLQLRSFVNMNTPQDLANHSFQS